MSVDMNYDRKRKGGERTYNYISYDGKMLKFGHPDISHVRKIK